jgi:hypothetical protein
VKPIPLCTCGKPAAWALEAEPGAPWMAIPMTDEPAGSCLDCAQEQAMVYNADTGLATQLRFA